MRPDRVVVDASFLDQDLGLAQVSEQLTVQEFILEANVEAFTVSVLPA
jgi:hypothetical protein